MKKLYQFSVLILDDDTFSQEEMLNTVNEALSIHLEAIGVKVELESVHDIILEADGAFAEA